MVSVNSHFSAQDTVDEEKIEAWIETLTEERDDPKLAVLRKVCSRALALQSATSQDDEKSALRQGISVAEILHGLGLDGDTLTAAVLHTLVSTGGIAKEQFVDLISGDVVRMMEDMLRIGSLPGIVGGERQDDETLHTEYLRRMLLSISEDLRVVFILLAERLHKMRTLKHQTPQVQIAVARDTHDIYAPLANRLGIWQIKWELEDLCLRYLHPNQYKDIASKLRSRRSERELFIQSVIDKLSNKFSKLGIRAEISGRPKHIYSIWKKMDRKSISLDQIFDLRALRVLVDDVADCYAVLGVVHGIWRYIPGEFDDYIATPKANLYRSIHTAVIGPDDRPLEIQIRTHEMHEHAELGIAAHWRYKEAGKQDPEFERRIVRMRNWLKLKDDRSVSEDFVDTLKSELESQHVYALTPQGRVIELAQGATPVDFAYAIHTDVGHRCRGAKIDGRMVTLTHTLESGKVVEILTTKHGGPSRDWLSPHLGYIKTSKARNRIRQWFKQQDYQQHLDQGRAALEREIGRLGVSKPDMAKAVKRFNFQKPDDLLAAIGRGEVSPIQVAGLGSPPKLEPDSDKPLRVKKTLKSPPTGTGAVIVEGVDDLMTHMARCCKPVPQDTIIGFITRGRGVTVHRTDCATIKNLNEQERQRIVEVGWTEQPPEASYPVDIRVVASDRKGLLRDVSAILTNEDIDVTGVSTQSNRKTDRASMRFTIEISDMRQLSRILDKVSQLPDVVEVRRQV